MTHEDRQTSYGDDLCPGCGEQTERTHWRHDPATGTTIHVEQPSPIPADDPVRALADAFGADLGPLEAAMSKRQPHPCKVCGVLTTDTDETGAALQVVLDGDASPEVIDHGPWCLRCWRRRVGLDREPTPNEMAAERLRRALDGDGPIYRDDVRLLLDERDAVSAALRGIKP